MLTSVTGYLREVKFDFHFRIPIPQFYELYVPIPNFVVVIRTRLSLGLHLTLAYYAGVFFFHPRQLDETNNVC